MLATESRALTGTLLANKYRLQKRLGAGGMGEVYRATNESIGRAVAIKILRPELLRNEDVVQRFLREAKAATLVRHNNVVDVLDVLEHDGVPFIVQELLSGEDLADYVESHGGRLPIAALLAVMIPVVEAVGTAHAKGVVHRDLKPANVFLHSADGEIVPKVLDFGISKITTGDTTRVTTTGTALGTPAYMSPEQIEGLAHVDARSDVWSLGVMLFELAAGSRPFVAETPGALFVKIATTAPRSLSEACPDCPRELVAIVERCLRASKSDRYDDARSLGAALRAYAEAHEIKLRDQLQSLRPRVSLVASSESAVLDPTLDEPGNPKPIFAETRAAAPDTAIPTSAAPSERVSQTNDLGPVSGRNPAHSRAKPKQRWAVFAVSLAFVATGAVFVFGRTRSTASTPETPSSAHERDAGAAATGQGEPRAQDPSVDAGALRDERSTAAAIPQHETADATPALVVDASAPQSPTRTSASARRPHGREHGEQSNEPSTHAAHEPVDSGVARVRGATSYE